MVICLERGADLHMAQLMPLPLTVSCFNKIQSGFTFLVPAHLQGSPKKGPLNGCVLVLGLNRDRNPTLGNRVRATFTFTFFHQLSLTDPRDVIAQYAELDG